MSYSYINKILEERVIRSPNLQINLSKILPGPSSTERGFPVLKTGSPTVKPAKSR